VKDTLDHVMPFDSAQQVALLLAPPQIYSSVRPSVHSEYKGHSELHSGHLEQISGSADIRLPQFFYAKIFQPNDKTFHTYSSLIAMFGFTKKE